MGGGVVVGVVVVVEVVVVVGVGVAVFAAEQPARANASTARQTELRHRTGYACGRAERISLPA